MRTRPCAYSNHLWPSTFPYTLCVLILDIRASGMIFNKVIRIYCLELRYVLKMVSSRHNGADAEHYIVWRRTTLCIDYLSSELADVVRVWMCAALDTNSSLHKNGRKYYFRGVSCLHIVLCEADVIFCIWLERA